MISVMLALTLVTMGPQTGGVDRATLLADAATAISAGRRADAKQ
jgi:hypothetical protein